MRSVFFAAALVVILGSAAFASLDLLASFPTYQGENGLWAEAYNQDTGQFRLLAAVPGYTKFFGTPEQSLNMPLVRAWPEGIKMLPSWWGSVYGNEWPMLTYKPPRPGVYSVQGLFSNANATGATTRGLVFVNDLVASPVFQGNVTLTTSAAFDLDVSLGEDDVLRFAVDPLGNNSWDHTWLNGVVAGVASAPEPTSLAAFAAGLLGFCGIAWRRMRIV